MKIVRLAVLVGVPLLTNGCCSTFCLIKKMDQDPEAAKTKQQSSTVPAKPAKKP